MGRKVGFQHQNHGGEKTKETLSRHFAAKHAIFSCDVNCWNVDSIVFLSCSDYSFHFFTAALYIERSYMCDSFSGRKMYEAVNLKKKTGQVNFK